MTENGRKKTDKRKQKNDGKKRPHCRNVFIIQFYSSVELQEFTPLMKTRSPLSIGGCVLPSVRPVVRPSIRPSHCPFVRPCVRPSVHPPIRPSVSHIRVEILRLSDKLLTKAIKKTRKESTSQKKERERIWRLNFFKPITN